MTLNHPSPASLFFQALGGSAGGIVICRAVIRDRYGPQHKLRGRFSMLMLALGLGTHSGSNHRRACSLMVMDWRGIFAVLAGAGLDPAGKHAFSMRGHCHAHSRTFGYCRQFFAVREPAGTASFMNLRIDRLPTFGGMFCNVAGSPYVIIRTVMGSTRQSNFGWFFGINGHLA